MRYISFCLFWASISLAAANYDSPPGSIARPGYDYKSIPYISSSTDAGINAMKDRYGASYVSCNSQVPSQAIIVSPATGIETNLITNSNIESITRAYLSTFLPPSCDLELISKKLVMNRTWFINFQKTLNGIPIEDATLNLAITPHGHISVLWGDISTSPINSVYFALPSDAAREIAGRGLEGTIRENRYLGNVILPLCFGQRTEYHPAHKTMIVTDNPYAEWLVYVDAENSQILQRTNKVYYDQISGSVSGVIQPLYPFDEWESRPFSDFNLNFDGYGVATTDSNGNYSFYIPNTNHANIISFLRGPYLEVIDSVGPESQIIDSIPSPSNYYIHWDDSNSLPQERDAWRNAVLAHNWIARFDSGLHVMDYPMTCNIDIPGACNAFWSSWYQTINFTGAGEDCPNIVQVADVVFHEYGHGITDLQTRPYGPNSAMHEGFSDYFACTITNQPHVGVGFYYNPPGSYLRNLDNSMKFPDNWTGDPHNDGQIISGALWHVRQALSPYPMGYADSLWHFARYAHAQSFDSYFWTLVALDDNDGNLSNGTPHAWTIFHNFGDRHGIGPGTQMTVVADTILDSEDTTATFPVSATITSVFTVRSDSVILFYDNGNGYEAISMVWNDTSWIAQIPSQHDNTHINYYILGVDSAGFRGTFPSGAPANYLSFYIGPDHNPPVLELVYNPSNTINLDGPYGPFIITARDINGINPSMVRMRYHVNSEPERTTSLLPGTNPDEYILASLQLSRYLFTGDTIYYYFTARDNAHTPNYGRLPASGVYSLAMATTELIENFETDTLSRWVVSDGWELSDNGRNSAHSIWFSSPNYPNNANAALTMNFDYDLSPYRIGYITFFHKNIIASGDSCLVEASNNGGASWYFVGAISDTAMPSFLMTQFNISAILRPDFHHYKIRFRFVSNENITAQGIFIDDVGWLVEPAVDGITDEAQLPRQIELAQNYPNPFNPETRIDFALSSKSNVRLEIFDLLGQQIVTLVDKPYAQGRYSVIWNGRDATGRDVASGVYFYRLVTDSDTRQAKMTLLR